VDLAPTTRLHTLVVPLLVAGCSAPDPGDTYGGPWSPAGDLGELLERVLSGTVDPRDRPALEAFVEEASTQDGPWTHSIRTATSEDGVAWTVDPAIVWEHASVPDAGIADDGRICVFAVDGAIDRFVERALANDPAFQEQGLVGLAGLALRCGEDGAALGPEEPLVVGGNSGVVVDPDVVRLDDGTWDLLYVTGDPVSFLEEVVPPGTAPLTWPRVARAEDGLSFADHAAADAGRAFLDPTHLREEDGSWWMLWSGLWTARSEDDERTWVVADEPEGLPAMTPDLVRDDGVTWLYHGCSGEPGICLARFVGEGEWVLEGGRLLERARAPTVVRVPDGTWRMYFVDDGTF